MTELFAVASVAFGKQKAKSEKQKKKKSHHSLAKKRCKT